MNSLRKHLQVPAAVQRAFDKSGPEMVDSSKETGWTPGQHKHLVDTFRTGVLDAPDAKPERGAKEAHKDAGAQIGKRVYRAAHPDGTTSRFLVRPYFERLPPLEGWKHPLQGWAEMTHQAAMHAAGLGHLTQRVHVVRGGTAQPLLVTHLEPNHRTVDRVPGILSNRREEAGEEVQRNVVMDFLAANPDRHQGNLLISDDDHPLAIDHGLAYAYARPLNYQGRKMSPPVDSFWTYHGDTAWDMIHPAGYDWSLPHQERMQNAEEQYQPTMEWWKEVGPKVVDTLHKRASMIRDPKVRAHILANVNARAGHLDDAAHGRASLFGRWVPMPVVG